MRSTPWGMDDWGLALREDMTAAGLGASVVLANTVYGIHPRIILDSAAHAVTAWDLITSVIKAWVFGVIIAVVRTTAS